MPRTRLRSLESAKNCACSAGYCSHKFRKSTNTATIVMILHVPSKEILNFFLSINHYSWDLSSVRDHLFWYLGRSLTNGSSYVCSIKIICNNYDHSSLHVIFYLLRNSRLATKLELAECIGSDLVGPKIKHKCFVNR